MRIVLMRLWITICIAVPVLAFGTYFFIEIKADKEGKIEDVKAYASYDKRTSSIEKVKPLTAPKPGQTLEDWVKTNDLSAKEKWKPKRTNNVRAYAGTGFNITTQLECNKCEKACWKTKGDKGGVTCLGFSMSANADLLALILSQQYKQCYSQGIMWDKNDPFGKKKDVCYYLRKAYWERYFRKYEKCTYSAMMHLGDTAVLQGHKATAKILQASQGLKVDGLWGPQSEGACGLKFSLDKYVEERIRVLKTYKDFPKFGEGWIKRVNKLKGELK